MKTSVAVECHIKHDSETMADERIKTKIILLQQKLKKKSKEGLLWRLQKFKNKGFHLSKFFTMESRHKEIEYELVRLHVLEDKQNTDDVEWSCFNFCVGL